MAKPSKQDAADVYDARLRAAMAEAHAAGVKAIEEFVARVKMRDGAFRDSAGWAFVEVRSPSYHLRESLKRLKSGASGYNGRWTVLGFGREIGPEVDQSQTAHEIGCKAAIHVMRERFPGEDFEIDSHMD